MKTEITISHLKGTFVEGAILVEWLKEDGALVGCGDSVATVETRKKTVDIPAPVGGILIHSCEEWDRLSLDEPIGFISDAGANA